MANPNPIPTYQFKKGQSGNPGGKPVNLRNSINAKFLKELSSAFDREGKIAIERVAREDPSTFIRVLAALQPKEMEIKRPLDDLSDEQLEAAYIAITAILNAQNSGSREETESLAEQAEDLQSVSETS